MELHDPFTLFVDLRESSLIEAGRIPSENWVNIPIDDFESLIEFGIDDDLMFKAKFEIDKIIKNNIIVT